MTRQELQRLRTWADAKIAAGQEPQWACYQLMKLREALDGIVGQMEAESIAIEMAETLPPPANPERGPRLVVNNHSSGAASAPDAFQFGMSIKSAGSR